MGTLIWLTITTLIGAFIGSHWFAAPIIGASTGFGIGLFLRLMVEAGGAGADSMVDGIGDIFDSFD